MKTFVDAILTGDPTAKVIINITSQDSHNPDGWGTTFPTNYQSKQNFRRNLRRLWELIIDEFDEGAYHANVFIGAAGLGLNRANPPFDADQFHPNAAGSNVMAKQQFPLILKLLQ
jgi:lysophospholipase L1-like esterase